MVTATDGTSRRGRRGRRALTWLARWRAWRVYVIALSAVIASTIAYAACDWSGWTRPLSSIDPYRGVAVVARTAATPKLAINS
ncbi:MAG: hypothetical protein HS111_15525 [Kofleriaceae bacterium]|nr:hypothetical protein [Kofleriaceae bacterium]